MWFLPTFNRPERCQAALDSYAAARLSPGIVWSNGGDYSSLKLPPGWSFYKNKANIHLAGTLNLAHAMYPDEPWYGFLSDDSLSVTQGFEGALVEAAGLTGIANTADGWQADKRLHGAVAFGGDLVRAWGWWAPPGLKHSFIDDAWEKIAKALGCWRHCPAILVEHRHALNGKAESDACYQDAYSSFDEDRAAYADLCRREIPEAIARAIPVAIKDDPQARRIARARSRAPMLATPIARSPAWQYALSLTDAVLKLQELGIAHARQFVIGSSNLPRARNELCARFLASPCTDLIFIDDDMGWGPDAIVRLLASDKAVCGAVGRKRVDKPNADLDVWCGVPDAEADGRLIQDSFGFVRMKRIGTGFLKISRGALEKIAAAKPEWKRPGHSGLPAEVRARYHRFFAFGDDDYETGEDFYFCDAWRSLGGEIWADPSIALAHVGEKAWEGRIGDVMRTD